MLLRSLSGALAFAGAALAACGQSAATPSASPTVPGGCSAPAGYVFTDGSVRAKVGGSNQTAQVAQTINAVGVWNEPFEASRPNSRFDPAFRGAPWLNVNLGSATDGVVVEIQGQDPCALSPDGSHSYVAVVLGRENSNRYGGNCSVTVDAFNSGGFRGRFNCTALEQFNAGSNAATVTAQGTFSATGHVYTPTPTATAAPTRTAAPTPTPTAPPTATPTPVVTPTALSTP